MDLSTNVLPLKDGGGVGDSDELLQPPSDPVDFYGVLVADEGGVEESCG